MTRFRGVSRARLPALLAIVAMAVQLVASALAIPAAFAAGRAEALPAGYTAITICTGTGLKRIVLDADGAPVEERSSDSDAALDTCAACHLMAGGAMPAPDAADVAHPEYRLAALVALPMLSVSDRQPFARPASRAPPLTL